MKVETSPNQWKEKKQLVFVRVLRGVFAGNAKQKDLSDRVDIALKEEGFKDPKKAPELL